MLSLMLITKVMQKTCTLMRLHVLMQKKLVVPNFIFITKDGKLVTPKSDSILPSITRRSLMYVAEHYLGMTVEHRPVHKDELKDFAEIGLCGTAAVISPVGQIDTPEGTINVPAGMDDMGPITKNYMTHYLAFNMVKSSS